MQQRTITATSTTTPMATKKPADPTNPSDDDPSSGSEVVGAGSTQAGGTKLPTHPIPILTVKRALPHDPKCDVLGPSKVKSCS